MPKSQITRFVSDDVVALIGSSSQISLSNCRLLDQITRASGSADDAVDAKALSSEEDQLDRDDSDLGVEEEPDDY